MLDHLVVARLQGTARRSGSRTLAGGARRRTTAPGCDRRAGRRAASPGSCAGSTGNGRGEGLPCTGASPGQDLRGALAAQQLVRSCTGVPGSLTVSSRDEEHSHQHHGHPLVKVTSMAAQPPNAVNMTSDKLQTCSGREHNLQLCCLTGAATAGCNDVLRVQPCFRRARCLSCAL